MKNKLIPLYSFIYAFLLTIILPFSCLAQSIEKLKEQAMNTKEVILTNGDNIEVFRLAARGAEKKADHKGNFYWWYGGSEIHRTQGAAGGRLLEGEYSLFSVQKDLLQRGRYEGGMRTGEWTTWYPDGTIREVSTWKKGLLQGHFMDYYPDGRVMREGSYKKGKLHGRLKEYDTAGKDTHQKYKNGVVKVKKSPKDKQEQASKLRTGIKSSFNAVRTKVKTVNVKLKQKLSERKVRRQQIRAGKGPDQKKASGK